jgi:hypothetical protein
MLKQVAFGLISVAAFATTSFAAVPGNDNAGNAAYQPDDANGGNDGNPANNTNGWVPSDNGGTGLTSWTFSTTGSGGQYIGTTGVGAGPTFGIFAGGGSGNSSSVDRSFGGALTNGQTFSFTIGNTNVATGGVIGFNLLDGTTPIFTIKFTGGDTNWTQNNGGTDFGIGQTFAANTPLTFSFTLVDAATKTYDYSFGSASGSSFVGSVGNYGSITGFRVFSSAQGGGENVGFNNLAVVPEPSTYALFAGPALLGALMYVRRRRA